MCKKREMAGVQVVGSCPPSVVAGCNTPQEAQVKISKWAKRMNGKLAQHAEFEGLRIHAAPILGEVVED